MTYYVTKRGLKWGLVFQIMENGKRTATRIKQNDLNQYGLRPDMSTEEARARAKQLNKEHRFKRQGELSKLRALNQANLERGLESKHFPPVLVAEFEERRLKAKFEFGGGDTDGKFKKALSRWRFARRAVIDLDVKPEDWAEEPRVFYSYFIKKQISLDYAAKVLGVLNMWGHFVSKKQGRPFLPIPAPRGYDREAIAEAYSNAGKNSKESLPLTPELLASVESKLESAEYRWLYVSLWFGLRPLEVEGKWKASRHGKVEVLHVYQSKLTTLSQDKRWKYIPAKYPEQVRALSYLKEGGLKRPTMWRLKQVLGEGFTTYAGRKGFNPLMLDKGEAFEDISAWLGHQNVDQTWRSYRDRMKVSFGKAS